MGGCTFQIRKVSGETLSESLKVLESSSYLLRINYASLLNNSRANQIIRRNELFSFFLFLN